MSRITEIRDRVADSSQNLEDALLQCLVLADELDYEPLREWVNAELKGYENVGDVPDYRKVRSHLTGTLIEGNSYSTGFSVPDHLLDQDMQKSVTTVTLFDGVGKLLHLDDDGSLSQGIIGQSQVEALINYALRKDYGRFVGMRSVILPIPPGTFVGVLSAVRQRLLTFLIELNRLFPSNDDIVQDADEKRPEVDKAFQRTVYNIHNPQSVVIADQYTNTDYSVNVTNIVRVGDFDSLGQYLALLGISEEQIERLRQVTDRLQQGDGSQVVEESLVEWMGDQLAELPKRGVEVVGEATKKAIAEQILDGIKALVPKMASWITSVDFPDVTDLPL